MPTINTMIRKPRHAHVKVCNVRALCGCPHKKGIIIKPRITKPKKPNSAQRKILKLRLSTRRKILAKIPGQGHSLRHYGIVLIRGGRANDLPGVRFSAVRGKYDFGWRETFERKSKRSKYGIPRRSSAI